MSAPSGEERVVWVQVRDGPMSKVFCRPDISVDDLKERIKDKYKNTLEHVDAADLTLTFKGRVLKPHEPIDVVTDEKDSGEPVAVIVVPP